MGSKKKDDKVEQRIDEIREAGERTVEVVDRRARRAMGDRGAGVGAALVAGGATALVAAAALLARRRRRNWGEAVLDTVSRRAASAGRTVTRRLGRLAGDRSGRRMMASTAQDTAARFVQAAGAAAGTAAVARMIRRR
jgi:LPXTG-motif cell wall-anchored protein